MKEEIITVGVLIIILFSSAFYIWANRNIECTDREIIENNYTFTSPDGITRECIERERIDSYDKYGRPKQGRIIYRECLPIEK